MQNTVVALQKGALNPEADVVHRCCKGEERGGGCQRLPRPECCPSPTTCAGGGEVLAPAPGELCQGLMMSQERTLLGVMGSYLHSLSLRRIYTRVHLIDF